MDTTILKTQREKYAAALSAEQQRIRELRAALDAAATNEQRLIGAIAGLDETLEAVSAAISAQNARESSNADDPVG